MVRRPPHPDSHRLIDALDAALTKAEAENTPSAR